jgi:hypothetical protein
MSALAIRLLPLALVRALALRPVVTVSSRAMDQPVGKPGELLQVRVPSIRRGNERGSPWSYVTIQSFCLPRQRLR